MALRYARTLLACLSLLICLAPAAAFAETSIAVVDIQHLLAESKAAKSIQKQLKNNREKFQKEISREEQDLRKEEERLVSLREKAQKQGQEIPAEFEKGKEAFQKDLIETRQLVQTRRQSLEKAAVQAMGQLRGEILQVVSQLADENGYDLVLTAEDVVLSSKSLDITSDVLARLDKKVSKIDVKVSQ